MKKILKRTALVLLAALVVIQFFHPAKNKQEGIAANHISNKYPVPDDVNIILQKACNDCHSNNTLYPWYNNIQPVAWWLNSHINEGKSKFNFSEFNGYPLRRQYRKLEEVINEVKEGGMPLDSYTWIHKDAKLTQEEKVKVTDWAVLIRKEMEANYPMDSLIRKK
jgi:Haem-binding domain